MSAYHKLRRRHQKFVDAYVETGDLGASATASGYKGKRASRRGWELKQIREVVLAIEERRAEAIEAAGRSAASILKNIGETLDRCMQHSPVIDKLGHQVMIETPAGDLAAAFTFDAKNALKAAELLGEFHKLFVKRHEFAGPGGAPLPAPTLGITFPDGAPGEPVPAPQAAGPVLST